MADEQRALEVPGGRILSVAPGMPCADMARTVGHYQRLGFTFIYPGASDPAEAGFAIAKRDGIELHFAVKKDHDPARTATWVYLGVQDADELAAEFIAIGAGQGRPVRDTDYFMREFAHIDPDGNLLLFGSPLPRDQQSGDQQSGDQQSGDQQSGDQQSGDQQSGGQQAVQACGEPGPGRLMPRPLH
jgi:catechol 2,3-dioxygenase-like lactoylglutathione lyase family enzyme